MNNLEERDDRVEDAWAGSLRDVLRDVIKTLPSKVTLGELVEATRSNPQLAPVLEHFTVQELIDLVKDRPRDEPSDLVALAAKGKAAAAAAAGGSGEVMFDEEGNPILDLDADELPAIQALDRLLGQAERGSRLARAGVAVAAALCRLPPGPGPLPARLCGEPAVFQHAELGVDGVALIAAAEAGACALRLVFFCVKHYGW